MEVAGIVIRFSDVDKQLEAIEQAEQAQPLVKLFIAFLVKCQRKVADQKGDVDVLSQELNYSVRKIVEKLAVGGPSPQFILALTEIISFFSVLSLSWLLSLLSEDANTGQQMAWVLMLAAATKSGKVTELVQKSKDPKKLSQITTVGNFLVEVAQSGGGLEELAFEGLFLLIEQLISFPDVLAKHLVPSFVPLLDSKSWNFNTMTLVLKLNENFKNLDLTTHTSKLLNKKIINPANLDLISSIFAYKIPKLDNQLWSLILKDVQDLPVGDKQTFVSGIWKTIAGSLASKKKDTKLLALFNWIWNLDEALQIPLLSDSFFIVLRRQQLSNNEDVTAIKERIKEACTKNPKLVGSTVLLSFPEMVVDLSQKIVTPVVHQMASNFYNQIQNPLRVAQALSQIARDTENSELALEILKFLFFHGFFVCKPNTTSKKPKAGKSLPKILGETLRPSISAQNPEKELGSSVLKQLQTLFFRAIVHRALALVSLQTSRKEKKEKQSTIVSSPFTSIIEFRVLLSTLSDQVEPRRPQEEENDAVLTNAEKLIGSAYKKLTQDTDGAKEFNAELDAFVVLLSVSYLIQLHDPVEPIETISDLIHCYQDVFESSKQKKATNDKNKEKAFAVLVDILISLQAKPMFLVGTLPEYCIKCFAKHLTAQSIDGIIKAITEYSLNKTEGNDEESDDEVDLMDDEDEPADGENIEDESENETDTANQTNEADDSSESDIYIDDLDDQTLMELDEVIAKIMQKERKPKMKQPPSNKEPDIEFRERVASLLHAFIKKTHTVAVVELLPQLLDAIFELQQQKRVQAQKADPKENSKETKLEATQKRQQKNKFYNSVTSLIIKSVMEICHTCGDVVEQLSAAKRASLSSVLLGHCSSTKGKEVSELAVESSLLLTKSPGQIISLLNDSAAKCSKQAVQYLVRRICLRFPVLVWTDPKLSALLIERYPKNVQAFVSSLDKEVLTQVGQNVVDKFVEQVKTKSDAKLLPIVRIIVLKMATLTNRDTVKEKFPELAFTLNTIIQTVSFSESHRKVAKQIATQALVGSQQSSKKREKAERKKRKLEDQNKSDDEEEEAEADPNSKEVKWKKGDLFYTKNKAYQNSRKRKKATDPDNTPKKKFAAKKKDTKWFKNQ